MTRQVYYVMDFGDKEYNQYLASPFSKRPTEYNSC